MDLTTTRAALALLRASQSFALVSTLQTSGSSPRHSGAAMIVKSDGSIIGTVGGGALEARAIRRALEVLQDRASCLMDYELTNVDAAGLGMICGGRGVLLVEYVEPAAGAAPVMYEALLALLSGGGRGWLVLRVNAMSGRVGVSKCLVDSGGSLSGDPVLPTESLRALARSGGALDALTAGDHPGIYVQPVGSSGTAYVFGAGHCGQSLIPLLTTVGFRTVIVDDRPEFANPERFPDADRVVVPVSFDEAVAPLSIDRHSSIVIMTRGHLFDRSVLAQALRSEAGYIGMIGSKKKIAETFCALREQGFTDQDLLRVHAPIGIAIAAETPEEIAVSICAEMIGVRHEMDRG